MNFKEWCEKRYGIRRVTEGRLTHYVLLEGIPGAQVNAGPLLEKYHGYLNRPDQPGLVLTEKQYQRLERGLRKIFLTQTKHRDFERYKMDYFKGFGLQDRKADKFRSDAQVHLDVAPEHKNAFMAHFSQFFPRIVTDELSNKNCVTMPKEFLNGLYTEYYASGYADIDQTTNVHQLQTQRKAIADLLADINDHNLKKRIEDARKLMLDYDNDFLSTYKASSAYALSLRAFAQLNRDNLSQQEYQSVLYASNQLAAYDEQGNLAQSLKSDQNFIDYIYKRIYLNCLDANPEHYENGRILIEDLPSGAGLKIINLIKENTYNLLNGASNVPLGQGKTFKMLRFLPDDRMRSETDELILCTGGSQGHTTVTRLVKVGIRSDGKQAAFGEQPHHYDYYKIENNLGEGLHNYDPKTGTCTGTYVTKLEPFTKLQNGSYVPLHIDPFKDPQAYQTAMAYTLQELIIAERQMQFYAPPAKGLNGEDASPVGSREAQAWVYWDYVKKQLSGNQYNDVVNYHSRETVPPYKPFNCSVSNMRGYIQSGGSCPIFSSKSFVTSVIGDELAALHVSFLQEHGADDHVVWLESKLRNLDSRIAKLSASEQQPQSSLYGDGNTLFKPAAKHPLSKLPMGQSIHFAIVGEDHYKPGQYVVKLRCINRESTAQLIQAIEEKTTKNPRITVTTDGMIILGQNRFISLCKALKLDPDKLLKKLPHERSESIDEPEKIRRNK